MITDYLHYKLETQAEEIKYDTELEYLEISKWGEVYRTKEEKLINLYGKLIGVFYKLTLTDGALKRIECSFNVKNFDLVFEGISNELPKGVKFDRNPFISSIGYFCYVDRVIISIDKYQSHFTLLIARSKHNENK